MLPFSAFARHFLVPLGRWVEARPKGQIEIACLLLAILIAIADYATGRDITLDAAYAVPISISAWFVGRTGAFLVMIAALAVGATATGSYTDFVSLVVNSLIHGAIYTFLIIALTRLSHLQHNLERRAEYRALALARETAERERLEQDMIEISEREQRRVGRDLHDGLCQHLLGTAFVGQALVEKLEITKHSEAAGAARMVSLVQQAIQLARGMARGLYPVGIENDGLMHALEEFSTSTSEMFAVNCHFVCHGPVLVRNQASATHLYRVAQEAVSNAIKHGRATEIYIILDETENGILLAVADNGDGLSTLPPRTGMGLKIIADRARMMGGRYAIAERTEGGTELSCWIPRAEIGSEGFHA